MEPKITIRAAMRIHHGLRSVTGIFGTPAVAEDPCAQGPDHPAAGRSPSISVDHGLKYKRLPLLGSRLR
jgi:hypothetical protein